MIKARGRERQLNNVRQGKIKKEKRKKGEIRAMRYIYIYESKLSFRVTIIH
jgi:hypothetical protein